MRKILSLVLVAAMLVCGMMLVPTSSAQGATANDSAEAYYFGGTTIYADILSDYGDSSNVYITDEWEIKSGDADAGELYLNGVIEDGEWGAPIAVIDSQYAANNDGRTWGKNNLFECPSAENTFFYYDIDSNKNSLIPKGLHYELYMMWDEEFVYIAAKVDDRDAWSNSSSAENIWDGDAFQFRFDTKGANSVCADGEVYDATGTPNPDYPETEYSVKPWADINYSKNPNNRRILSERVGNFMTGFTTSGYSEIYDASCRYEDTATVITYTDEATEELIEETMLGPADISYYSDFADVAYSSIQSEKYGSAVFQNLRHVTHYEVAIPWELIDAEYTPEAGAELGTSAVIMNGTPSNRGVANNITGWLAWGGGITGGWENHNPHTAGGSNAVTLSTKTREDGGCYHETYNPATCTEPETCADCGRQRGYTIGHSFDFSNASLNSENTNGGLTGTCTVCGAVENYVIPSKYYEIKHTFKTTDTKLTSDSGFYSGYTAQWRISTELDADDNRVGELATLPNGQVITAFNNTQFPGMAVLDLYNNGEERAVEDFQYWTNEDGETTYPHNEHQAGTYFAADSYTSSYSYKMDLYFPTLDDINPEQEDDYSSGIRNQVGDGSRFGFYNIGLHEVEGEWYFAIIPEVYGNRRNITQEEFEAHALDFVKATPEQLSLNTWHEYAVMFDDVSDTAMFAWDGELLLAASDYHMNTKEDNTDTTMFWRRFHTGAYAKDCVLGTSSVFADYVEKNSVGDGGGTVTPPVGEKYTVTVDGEAFGYAAGETVELSKATYVDKGRCYRFITWEGDVDVLADATAGTTSFTMPEKDITLTSKFVLVGDLNDDGALNSADINLMKQISTGSFNRVPQANIDNDAAGNINAADLNLLKRMLTGTYSPEA